MAATKKSKAKKPAVSTPVAEPKKVNYTPWIIAAIVVVIVGLYVFTR